MLCSSIKLISLHTWLPCGKLSFKFVTIAMYDYSVWWTWQLERSHPSKICWKKNKKYFEWLKSLLSALVNEQDLLPCKGSKKHSIQDTNNPNGYENDKLNSSLADEWIQRGSSSKGILKWIFFKIPTSFP